MALPGRRRRSGSDAVRRREMGGPGLAVGPARFGLKAYGGREQSQGEGWHTANRGLVGLLSLELSAQWQLHLNFGEEYVHGP